MSRPEHPEATKTGPGDSHTGGPLVDIGHDRAATREAFHKVRQISANDRVSVPRLDDLAHSMDMLNDADRIHAALGKDFERTGQISPQALKTIDAMMQKHPGEIAELQDQVNQVLNGKYKLNLRAQPEAQYPATGHHGDQFIIQSVDTQTQQVADTHSIFRPHR